MVAAFQTPTNERSFSALIDAALVQTGKPASLIQAVSNANMTIRECQALGLFARDLIEDQIEIDVAPFIFDRPAYFRKLRSAKYINACIYPDLKLPGRAQRNQDNYFYAADDYFVFSGCPVGETLGTAIYYWAKPLGYYGRLGTLTVQYPGGPYSNRPAYFDTNTDVWMYLNTAETAYVTTTGDEDEDALRRQNSSNWLIDSWYDLILAGTKAKLFSPGDDNRANREYAFYKATQKLLQTTEAYEAEGF